MVRSWRLTTRFFVRAMILIWRTMCACMTFLRHPFLYGTPSLFVRYLSAEQHRAIRDWHAPRDLREPHAKRSTRILVVIPFRDKWSYTEVALESIFAQDLGSSSLMVALVDNRSTEAETQQGLARWLFRSHAKVQLRLLRYDIPFNFSKLNNMAINDCADFAPDLILFMNNDIKLEDPLSISMMQEFMDFNPQCGSVGCTLLYPNGRVQHLFVHVGCKIVGAHPLKGALLKRSDPWIQSPQPVGAATGALLMVRPADLAVVGGLEEALPSCYQDIDLALKLQQLGKVNWVLPYIMATHYESVTRDPVHNWQEVRYMYERWGKYLTKNPYTSSRFSRWSERPVLSLGEGAYPWHWIQS